MLFSDIVPLVYLRYRETETRFGRFIRKGDSMRILMVENDKKLCTALQFQLEKEGFCVDMCHDGDDGLAMICEQAHDLILLDRMLPGMDGLTVLTKARTRKIHTPIIFITALGELSDRVTGLDAGADDYILKPFAFAELMARIRCLLRRPASYSDNGLLSFGDLSYDANQKLLTGNTHTCSLSRRESELLELFLRNPNQTLPRALILSRVWGPDAEVEDGNLDNYIYFLRRRLKAVESCLSIRAVRGIGYRLEDSHA